MPGKYKIVMIRHGESEWNQKNLFCGWFDADLSDKGREEALSAGKALKAEGYQFDVAHTSVLKRAQITLNSVLQEIGQTDIPINKTWRLNERHYGLSDAAIMELNLPTGIPFVYELDEDMKPVDSMTFLGDEETVKKAMAAVAAQGKAK
ncbi:Phosphoglyceromutase [Operophtera brumata]|uniref:Phosphoglycerate mutase n=1 Tax=Operophtera brumata TaxID=104452 RepID=A0A0L7L634_OPEBR|nr:Phosphoglyceromutase [Operophtera brumata]